MIEVIYDKKDEKEGQILGTKEQGATSETQQDTGFKLPKNIRQIGTPPSNKRIYIEDYVVTYLNYIARPGSTHARGAVLLGEVKQTEIGMLIFISGAVEAENLEFDMDESEFTQEIWTDIYDKVKEFFPDLIVVGWFLSRMGFSTAINSKIEKLHVDNFPGHDKVLYITDSLESDDAFYMYEHGQLVKQKGYYIFYSKNENMQSYIVAQKGGESDESDTEIKRKDEAIIKTYREKNKNLRPVKQEGIHVAYVACSFLVLGMLALGISVVNNHDKMKQMEVSINRLEMTAEEQSSEVAETLSVKDADVITPSEEQKVDINDTSENQIAGIDSSMDVIDTPLESTEEGQQPDTIEEPTTEVISTEQTLPVSTGGAPTYYTICYGDSLSSIAYNQYGSIKYAEDIAKANNMLVDDPIYEGDTLILPSVTER
ncbi:MAG: LysM domain-containing protein [Eubacteriales bacterium]|nr:LysM domain-containing protein [Eubacteriales bacterium]